MARAIPILMYHSLDKESGDRWTLSTSLFAEHMKWLSEHDYRSMTVSAFVKARRAAASLPPRTVVITFDDGLRDFLTEAMPVLQRYGLVATLYVVTGLVGKICPWSSSPSDGVRNMLSWDELRMLPQSGIECGGHTHTHPQLDIVPSDEAAAEIRRSKAELEDHLECRVDSFAYPHGYANREIRRLVREAGFTSACRVRHALSSTREDPFALSRIIVTNDISANEFESLFAGDVLPTAPPADRLVSAGWRLVRKIGHKVSREPSRTEDDAGCQRADARPASKCRS
jgi:O-antigen biosynthesis protein